MNDELLGLISDISQLKGRMEKEANQAEETAQILPNYVSNLQTKVALGLRVAERRHFANLLGEILDKYLGGRDDNNQSL